MVVVDRRRPSDVHVPQPGSAQVALAHADHLFRALDTNNDGVIDRNEFVAAYNRDRGILMSPPQSPPPSAPNDTGQTNAWPMHVAHSNPAPAPFPSSTSGDRWSGSTMNQALPRGSPPRSVSSLTRPAGSEDVANPPHTRAAEWAMQDKGYSKTPGRWQVPHGASQNNYSDNYWSTLHQMPHGYDAYGSEVEREYHRTHSHSARAPTGPPPSDSAQVEGGHPRNAPPKGWIGLTELDKPPPAIQSMRPTDVIAVQHDNAGQHGLDIQKFEQVLGNDRPHSPTRRVFPPQGAPRSVQICLQQYLYQWTQ